MHLFHQRSFLKPGIVSTGLALCVISALLAGCGGGGSGSGSSGPNPTVPAIDLHGDFSQDGTRIFPDNGIVFGAINTGTDIDYFQFNGTLGVTYTVQVELTGNGTFTPPFPNDMNTRFDLVFGVYDTGGGTLLGTSANFPGGGTSPFDGYLNDPAGFEDAGDAVFLSDSRITFTAPATGRYFIGVIHERALVGTGNYILNLSSSQLGQTPIGRSRFSGHFVSIPNEDEDPKIDGDEFLVNRNLVGTAGIFSWNAGEVELGFGGFSVPPVTFPGDDEPQNPVGHLHFGDASARPHLPHASINRTFGEDDPHPSIIDLANGFARRSTDGSTYEFDAIMTLSSGEEIIIPATGKREDFVTENGEAMIGFSGVLHFGQIRGVGDELTAGILRLITGFDWYADNHFTDNFDLYPLPVSVSMPHGDVYGVFETDILFTDDNVVRGGTRGFLPDYHVFLDNALNLFQIASNEYRLVNRTNGNIFSSIGELDSEEFAIPNVYGASDISEGDILRIYRGGIGQTGAELIDLGEIPARNDEPQFFDAPGIRTPIHFLTVAEMQDLRQAFYTGGWYAQILDKDTLAPLVRGEGSFWEIQTTPNDQFPFPVRDESSSYEFGNASFVSDYADGGAITVIANGKIIGVLDQTVSDESMPACGEESIAGLVATDRYIPQTYPYRAFAEDGTEWKGTFTVENGGCNTVVLSAPTIE